jgi:hypothetical protein
MQGNHASELDTSYMAMPLTAKVIASGRDLVKTQSIWRLTSSGMFFLGDSL